MPVISSTAVAGLARQLNVSTALLNLRFNEILGHGPKEETVSLSHDSDLQATPPADIPRNVGANPAAPIINCPSFIVLSL